MSAEKVLSRADAYMLVSCAVNFTLHNWCTAPIDFTR